MSVKQDKLKILMSDEMIVAALKDEFDEVIDTFRPDPEKIESDYELGQNYRAYETSKMILSSVFKKLEEYRPTSGEKEGFNRER